MKEELYWIWFAKLNLISKEKLDLIKKYAIEELWNMDKSELMEELKNEKKVETILDKNVRKNLEKHLEFMSKNDIEIITYFNEKYPINLRHIYDAPVVLFAKGDTKLLNQFSFAMVGARNASNYGKKIAENFAYNLSKKNINIVSGLAKGIDTASHIGVLKAKGKTTAVMGTGFDNIYPKENTQLYKNIILRRWTGYNWVFR